MAKKDFFEKFYRPEYNAGLSWEEKEEVLRRADAGESREKIAANFGITEADVEKMVQVRDSSLRFFDAEMRKFESGAVWAMAAMRNSSRQCWTAWWARRKRSRK
jgi:hypothetical protein